MKIFIDFDGTICPNKNRTDLPPPTADCIDVINELKKAGYMIVIYSVRSNLAESNKVNGHEEMVEYLNFHKIPYDKIDFSKPYFNVLIDDKSIGIQLDENRNVNWSAVKSHLRLNKDEECHYCCQVNRFVGYPKFLCSLEPPESRNTSYDINMSRETMEKLNKHLESMRK